MAQRQTHTAELEALQVPVADLKHFSKNPRQGDVALIVGSLRRLGQYRPVVVNRRTSEVLAGNHTLKAAKELGWETIAATYVDVDEETAARIALVDNRANDVAGYDDQILADLLTSLPDLDATGYDQDALDALLESLKPEPVGLTDPDDVPEAPKVAVTQLGDLWLLGEHRLLCGDSRDMRHVEQLMDGLVAAMVFTPTASITTAGPRRGRG